MTIRSHPQPDTLISYASGTLPCAITGVVACHVSVCERCRADMRRLELLGGLLLERQRTHGGDAEAAEAFAKRCILAHGFVTSRPDAAPAPVAPDDPLLPSPLVRYLGMSSDEIPWKSLPRGVKQYWVKLPEGAGLMRLLKVPPRTQLLEHSHHGQEVTMVLKGVYSDYTGDYLPGDVCEMSEGMEHRPVGSSDGECVCIVASEFAPHYSQWYARLLRPLLGL